MFSIEYDTWKEVCNMYFKLNKGSLKSYLQWFPFTKLSGRDKKEILGQNFYNTYIKSGSFLLFNKMMYQSENFIQKSDGSFRESALVSPILYLILQSIGKEIYKVYSSTRPTGVSVYYAGNYENMYPKYKKEYDEFFKDLNKDIHKYQYFIKTDISNFYSSINMDILFAQINKRCNEKKVIFSQTQLHLMKEFIRYCGKGSFPLIENSMASSFLATIVYMDDIDKLLYEYIEKKITTFSEFRMVRYVDDMYILISSKKSMDSLYWEYNEIRNEYSSILKKFNLALNTKKMCFKEIKDMKEELKKSLYDDVYDTTKYDIDDKLKDSLKNFLSDLSKQLDYRSIDIEKYNELLNKNFYSSDTDLMPSEIFNYFIYENDEELKTNSVRKEIEKLVKKDISFISLDPKRLTIMIMKTGSDDAIKSFLSHLFNRNKLDKWNSYDTTIALTYLIQSRFQHRDLLECIFEYHSFFKCYYLYNCKNSFLTGVKNTYIQQLIRVISTDKIAHYLYFMYFIEIKRGNYMVAFAYYKNFFDRVTADMEFYYKKTKKISYNKFYRKDDLKDFYFGIYNSDKIIKEAHKLRNSNPLSHASAELFHSKQPIEKIKRNIRNLNF